MSKGKFNSSTLQSYSISFFENKTASVARGFLMYPIFRLINSYDFPCFNRIRLEISLQFRKKVEHTLLQTKWFFDDNLWALSIHPTTNKAHCFNQFIAPSALLLKKKIHWTCKWIILIEWRLLKKYVTCLHRDAVRKTDVH